MKPHLFLPFLLLLIGCSDPSSDEASLPTIDNTAEVEAYYEANPDFFKFKTLDDLPQDLTWVDGSDLSEVGSPNALKGGTETVRLADFPRTLRTVGPDSNGSFRPWILDDTSMAMAHRHPESLSYYPGLARRWAVDEASKTVFVELDPEATWSDGVPITADDYLFIFWFYLNVYLLMRMQFFYLTNLNFYLVVCHSFYFLQIYHQQSIIQSNLIFRSL